MSNEQTFPIVIPGWRDLGMLYVPYWPDSAMHHLAWTRWYFVDKQRQAILLTPSFTTYRAAYLALKEPTTALPSGVDIAIVKGQVLANRHKHFHVYLDESNAQSVDKIEKRRIRREASLAAFDESDV